MDLDPGLPQARAQLGDALIYKGQPDAAIAEFERAIALNPNFIDYRYAKALSYAGESARAFEIPEANMRLDPFQPLMSEPIGLGMANFTLNRYGGSTMKRRIAFLAVTSLAAIALCDVGSVDAEYSVIDKGTWPESWPKELEPLRKQARTLVGPRVEYRHYAIPFTKREEFESAWPHLLKVNSKSAALRLVRAPNFFLGEKVKAGVVVHSPPLGQADNPATPEAPLPGVTNAKERWMYTTYIELIVDGDIVDLNRIPLPADTPIVDERFKDGKKK